MPHTSTPLPHASGSKKRKSLCSSNGAFPHETPLKRLASITAYEEDDEQERSLRRAVDKTTKYSKEEMKLHMDTCMQLYADNKINAKNVWTCHIIDHMNAMVRDNIFEKDTLKYATATMEVGAKVYGLRVDSVYDQTVQLATNLQRNFNDVDAGEEGNNEGNTSPRTRQKRTRQVKLLPGKAPSIIKDYTDTFKPIKQMISTDFNLGKSTNKTDANTFLSYSVPVNTDGYFMCLSQEKCFGAHLMEQNHNQQEELIEWEELSTTPLKLCPAFADFALDVIDPNISSFIQTRAATPIDGEGNPIPELDGSIHDPFNQGEKANILSSDDEEEEEVVINEMQLGQPNIQYITDTIMPDVRAEGTYSYISTQSSQMILNLWAGPHHWKLKTIQQRASTFTGIQGRNDQKTTRKRRKKTGIAQVKLSEKETITQIDLRKARKPAKLRSSGKFRIPMKLVSEANHPKELLRNRSISIATSSGEQRLNDDEENAHAEDGFHVDSMGYHNADVQNADDDDDDDEGNNVNNVLLDGCGQASLPRNFDENNFEMPEIVPKSTIAYARTAKKMNMKKLKSAVWDCLANCDTYTQRISTQLSAARVDGAKDLREVHSNVFQMITPSMKEALSLPLTFSALLHLGNEKRLRFQGTEDLKTMKITQD